MPDYMKEKPRRNSTDGTFELTVRCNLHCKMSLFRHADSENGVLLEKELTAQQWIELAKQAAEAGTIKLLITGGEPMLRNDFCEIWEGIYQQGFILELYTNATLVDEKILSTLKKYPPHKIGITIYGASEETYDKVCGNAEAYKKMIAGVNRLLALPSVFEFRTTIIKDNLEDINKIEELVHRKFGEQYVLVQSRIVNKPVRGACGDISCRLDPVDNVRLAYRRAVNLIKEKTGSDFKEKYIHLEQMESSNQKVNFQKPTLLGCEAGMTSYTLSYDGKLLGCQILGAFFTDAVKDGFQQAWEKFPLQVKLPPLNEKCQKCDMIDFCHCCFASRFAETGDLGGFPEYICNDTMIVKHLMEKGGFTDENE